MLWSTTGRQLIKVAPLTSVSCSPEPPIVRQRSLRADFCFPTQTLLLNLLFHCNLHDKSLLAFYSSSAFAPSHSSPPHSAGFMCLRSLSPHTLSWTDDEPGKPALPHCWSLWCFLCLRYLGKTEARFIRLCSERQSHELLSAEHNGANMSATLVNFFYQPFKAQRQFF